MCHKTKLKFEHSKNCLEATQSGNEINPRDKNKADVKILTEDLEVRKIMHLLKKLTRLH